MENKISLIEYLKTYTAIPIKFINEFYKKCYRKIHGIPISDVVKYLGITSEKNRCFYEWIDNHHKVKLYIDIDIKLKHIKGDRNECLNFYITNINKLVKTILMDKFNIFDDIPYIVLKSKDIKTKLAAHLIYSWSRWFM